ncbi:type II secretion system minor pseudopilin GspK [Vibrio genomosp. F10]|uniref:Type II secretion system protein K n=1 Tax=Vibrio genomosp. F10 TaxID=723171 RepID=A0A1B9QVB5_9VIBR|nr:type II secretion system minor pseudopilin GspK [Vibrio genomosp. F10]OCH72851.1 general secretion pathway protein GspK [Vibrio genomosp. F10]
MNQANNKQRGVALIIVLMLLAVMVSLAATMSSRLFTQYKRGSNQVSYQQAYWYSIGVESLAKTVIEQSFQDSDTINLSQPWALEEQTYPLDFGTLSGRMVDKQACFNLNVFSRVTQSSSQLEKPYLIRFWQTLLEEVDVDNYQAEVIADSTWEFINQESSVQSSQGVGDSYYESLSPAYMAANGFIADPSELRAIQQVSGDVMQKIAPYICALPSDDWRLNVNTINADQSALLVAMFQPHLSQQDAISLIESRPFDGWASVEGFIAESSVSVIEESVRKEAQAYLSVDSAYFESDAEVLVNDSRVRIRSLLFSDNRETATVIRRRFGGFSERVSDSSTE